MLRSIAFLCLLMGFSGCSLMNPKSKEERKDLSFWYKLMNPWEADDWSPAQKTLAFAGPGH